MALLFLEDKHFHVFSILFLLALFHLIASQSVLFEELHPVFLITLITKGLPRYFCAGIDGSLALHLTDRLLHPLIFQIGGSLQFLLVRLHPIIDIVLLFIFFTRVYGRSVVVCPATSDALTPCSYLS